MNSIPIINYIEEVKKGFDLLADHVVITDARGKILYLNPAAEKKTGFSATEALGKKPGEQIELEVPAGKVIYKITKIH